MPLEKYGVLETQPNELVKEARKENTKRVILCPWCDAEVEIHGNVLICPNCGSEPFEIRKR